MKFYNCKRQNQCYSWDLNFKRHSMCNGYKIRPKGCSLVGEKTNKKLVYALSVHLLAMYIWMYFYVEVCASTIYVYAVNVSRLSIDDSSLDFGCENSKRVA